MINSLFHIKKMEREHWRILLTSLDEEEKNAVRQMAVNLSETRFGKGIFIRGLIEISSYCRNNCYYCGLRCENKEAQRYRLDKNDILKCCDEGNKLGFNTFVLQGGEDPAQNDEWITDIVGSIRERYPEKAITLSVGERSAEAYRSFKKAGADRYLLRHETRNDEHYSILHPANMSAKKRRECLWELKKNGFQTGSGMMIGTPMQTVEHIIDDLQFLEELQPEMIGIGPFIPASGTPFADKPQGTVEETILLISLLRIRFPDALIPATTALASIHPRGREYAILAGANVVMPNLTPKEERKKYTIYDHKKNNGSESAQQLYLLEKQLKAIGYHIDYTRGDHKKP